MQKLALEVDAEIFPISIVSFAGQTMKDAVGREVSALIARARKAAQRRGHQVSSAHVLLVMLQQRGEPFALLHEMNASEMELVRVLREPIDESANFLGNAVERATQISSEAGEAVRGRHLLEAFLREPRSAAYKSLERIGVRPNQWKKRIYSSAEGKRRASPSAKRSRRNLLGDHSRTALKANGRGHCSVSENPAAGQNGAKQGVPGAGVTKTADLLRARQGDARVKAESSPRERYPAQTEAKGASSGNADLGIAVDPFVLDEELFPILARYGRNLSRAAADSEIDPVIHRESELEQIVDILGRRRANSPVLVGGAGVGKTALVEGLALRMIRGDNTLRGFEKKILVELSVGALVSGTGVRGALSERMRQLKEELGRAKGSVMIFLDDLHAALGQQDQSGELTQELKGLLGDGSIACIAAIHDQEYRRIIQRDPMLARRFSPVHVHEPSAEQAVLILRGVIVSYEKHHGVAYDPEAVRRSVELTGRYLPEQKLPDKAISVLDLAGARVARAQKQIVRVDDVAQVVAERAHVPQERLVMKDQKRLLQLEKELAARVVGQKEAVSRVSEAIRKGAAGFHTGGPLSTMLFLGPTGVGKTEMAKTIAELVFGECNLTRLDLSEFGESHAVSRLFGSPPGYVGHEEGGQLTEAVRQRPYQLILLDEVEKAHRDVLMSLLPLLDEGRLTDGRGNTVDFSNTIVVMTSNLGVSGAARSSIGFGDAAENIPLDVIDMTRKQLAPELWNRIDEPICFQPLDRSDVAQVAKQMVSQVLGVMREKHQIEVSVDPGIYETLADSGGFDPELGARPMRRVIARLIESPLAKRILSGELSRGARLKLWLDDKQLRFELS